MHVPEAQLLAESVASLVQIPSVNPLQFGPLAERHGPAGEAALAGYVAERCAALGADLVELDEVFDGRPNVYARLPGRSSRLVVLDVHLDTVSVEHMTDPPFDGRIESGHVWGRGALDTKASLGVALALLAGWHGAGLRPEPTLLLVGTVGEEAGGLPGAGRFREWVQSNALAIDQMVVAEPSQLSPIHGHKGGVIARVIVRGRACHSAVPHLGANAIEGIAPVIVAFADEHRRLQTMAPTTELGTATLSVTTIHGGTAGNVIPDRCEILVSRRTIPGEDPVEVFRGIEAIATGASTLPVEVVPATPGPAEFPLGSPAFYRPADTPLATLLASVSGRPASVAPFGTNAIRYPDLASQLVVFGPGSIDDAHQATECVRIDELVTLASAYTAWLDPR